MTYCRAFRQLSGRIASYHQSPAPADTFAKQRLSSWAAVPRTASTCEAQLGRGTAMPAALRACQQGRALASSSSPQLSSCWAVLCNLMLKQPLQSSPRHLTMGPATVRRWQPSKTPQQCHQQDCTGSLSTARPFSTQAQRAQQRQRQRLQKQSSEQGVYLVALVVGMVGLTYASVPLYRYSIQGLHIPHPIKISACVI